MDFVYGEIDMCPLDFIPFSLPVSQQQQMSPAIIITIISCWVSKTKPVNSHILFLPVS